MKVVSIWSGGVDSTTLVWWLRSKGYEVYTLTFDYGQRHRKEILKVKEMSEKYGIPNIIVDLSNIKDLISNSALTGNLEVPHAMYDEESQKVTFVPNRNMIMLSIAIGYAYNIGAREVYYGAHGGDHAIYPDCRPEFVKALDLAAYLGNYGKVEVKAPFINMTKDQVVKIGLELGVPYELTWSCYEGGERPCLRCGTCLERTEAFLKNNAKDPLLTDEEWEKAVKIYFKMKKQ